MCGRAESRSGEDARQRESIVVARPVAFCHVLLILESTAVEGRTTGGARECGRHRCAVGVRLQWLVSSPWLLVDEKSSPEKRTREVINVLIMTRETIVVVATNNAFLKSVGDDWLMRTATEII